MHTKCLLLLHIKALQKYAIDSASVHMEGKLIVLGLGSSICVKLMS